MIQTYKIVTSANEPGHKVGSRVFATSLLEPERFDFICFLYREEADSGNYVYIYRLCGLPGDTMEFRQGDCYIDGKFRDDQFPVKHTYYATGKQADRIIDEYKLVENDGYRKLWGTDTVTFDFTSKEAQGQKELYRYRSNSMPEQILKTWGQMWTAYDFGPVVVPEGHFFVLGDNRDNSRDSRYIGFIKKENVVGVVF